MIEASAVPFAVRGMLRAVEGLTTTAQWRVLTSHWPEGTKVWTIAMRNKGENERMRLVREGLLELQNMTIESRQDKNDGTDVWVAIACLSDAQLDLVIESFGLNASANDK